MTPADARSRLPLRERLGIRLERVRRWEFWPGWLFYIPVVCWILFCGLRFRHWTAFTAANPGMDNGSVVGERKSRTLLALAKAHPQWVPETHLLSAGAATAEEQVDEMASRHGWPLILKPDIGQRGRGVALIHSPAQAQAYLRAARAANLDILLQAFVRGVEYGVFVRRVPGSPLFEVSSLTYKALPRLQGDGERTLFELIRHHPRARLIWKLLFKRHAQRLDEVIAVDAEVQLVDLGAHCRGAEFRDGMDLITPQLTARMQQLATAIPGFGFGRIDLRCPNAEALRRGQGLQILEINGVTSEPAHFYHPGTPLIRGIVGFCEHWTRAFALGAENLRTRRAVTVPPLTLLRLFREDLARFAGCESASLAAAQAGAHCPSSEIPSDISPEQIPT